MDHQRERIRSVQRRNEPLSAAEAGNRPDSGSDALDEVEPHLLPEDIWDAFELDDETADPQPEPGDFWGEVEDEEEIWAV
jgi:hypothetical protein